MEGTGTKKQGKYLNDKKVGPVLASKYTRNCTRKKSRLGKISLRPSFKRHLNTIGPESIHLLRGHYIKEEKEGQLTSAIPLAFVGRRRVWRVSRGAILVWSLKPNVHMKNAAKSRSNMSGLGTEQTAITQWIQPKNIRKGT